MTQKAVYAILGYPVRHSQSPAMHNAAFDHLKLPATYVSCEVHPTRLPAAIAGLRALGISGANVTLPHKTAVCQHLDGLTPEASAIGAVNTLFWEEEQLRGDNTDAAGLARALQEGGATLERANITLLGAGGAARAAVVGLARAGAASIHVLARRVQSAEALIADLQLALVAKLGATSCELTAAEMTSGALRDRFPQTDLLVQATSATLGTASAARDFAAALPFALLPEHTVVTDLVYKPLRTTVLVAAEARQLRTVDGLGMLLHQGALAFERWTGHEAPIAVMHQALLAGVSA